MYAYRYLNDFDQVVENQSDEGEPIASSGPPIDTVLRGENLVKALAIIVKYFRGIKLEVGGLVRANAKSVHITLEQVTEK